jgi:hypothetical protein
MNMKHSVSASVRAVEALMLEKFRSEPFHNFHLLYGEQLQSPLQGGTCSDKTLSFLSAAKRAGFDASLHSAYIGGSEIHRLARVRIGDEILFADVGNGWPAIKLYPADREISYRSYGMSFRTEIVSSRIIVFNERQGQESLQLEIDVSEKPESQILADIDARFSSGVTYPFSNSLRFSLLVEDKFLFLRGDRLEIYSDKEFDVLEGIEPVQVSEVIQRYFGYEIKPLPPFPIESGECES